MAQTVSRRPSPLRETTFPSPTATSPSLSTSRHGSIDVPTSRPRPKSIINRILRNSTIDSSDRLPGALQARPVAGEIVDEPISDKSDKKRRGSNNIWDMRASRKPPPPPARKTSDTMEEESFADDYTDGMIHGDLPLLSRQPRPVRMDPPADVQVSKWMNETSESERGFEMVGVVPKVFLHPPEEEETEPIKLYPLPPPPQIARPPLIHFPSSSSRPSSLFSVDSTMSTEGTRNTWGGMSSKFNKPPPVFKRGSTAMRAGIVMPKKREEVQRDRERRVSMYNPEDMDWQAGASSSAPVEGITSPPRRRASSPPAISSPPISARPSSPPIGDIDMSRPPIPFRAYSDPVTSHRDQSPPRIMVTSESSASMASLATETAHSLETSETGFYSLPQRSSLDDDGFEPIEQAEVVVESPITFDSPELPEPLPSIDELATRLSGVPEDTMPVVMSSIGLGASLPEDVSLNGANVEDRHLDLVDAESNAKVQPHRSSSGVSTSPIVDAESDSSVPSGQFGPSGSRRSMSLSSLVLPGPSETTPRAPIVSTSSVGKTIRKQKSLKRFFFSNGDLASEEKEPVPRLDKALLKEKADKSSKKKVATTTAALNREAADEENLVDKGKNRSGFSSVLSRPRSKPSLRIDVKASRQSVPSAPASAPSVTSVPTSTPHSSGSTSTSSGSSAYPETPVSTVSSKVKFKGTPGVADSASGGRGLTKRFSLSNMSSAFKRSKRDLSSPVPQVPDLPTAYKKDAKGRSLSDDSCHTAKDIRGMIKESAVPLSPKLAQSAILQSPKSRDRPLLSPPLSQSGTSSRPSVDQSGPSSPRSPKSIAETLPPPSPKDTASILSETSSTFELDEELTHAQLMLVSPRTRRNPAESLQDILGVAPISRQSRIVRMEPAFSRRSVEAIVLGPLLVSPSSMEPIPDIESDVDRRDSDLSVVGVVDPRRELRYDSEASLETLSRSSSTSDPLDHTAPVTPVSDPCAMPLVLPPPLPPLPPLSTMPSDMIIVDTPSMTDIYASPTSTITTSRRSPEAIFRFLSGGSGKDSPKSAPSSKRGSKEVMMNKVVEGEYTSLTQATQLKSLHFDSLGLDFDGYAFPPNLIPPPREVV